jgi:hypothetical protein
MHHELMITNNVRLLVRNCTVVLRHAGALHSMLVYRLGYNSDAAEHRDGIPYTGVSPLLTLASNKNAPRVTLWILPVAWLGIQQLVDKCTLTKGERRQVYAGRLIRVGAILRMFY